MSCSGGLPGQRFDFFFSSFFCTGKMLGSRNIRTNWATRRVNGRDAPGLAGVFCVTCYMLLEPFLFFTVTLLWLIIKYDSCSCVRVLYAQTLLPPKELLFSWRLFSLTLRLLASLCKTSGKRTVVYGVPFWYCCEAFTCILVILAVLWRSCFPLFCVFFSFFFFFLISTDLLFVCTFFFCRWNC